VRSTPEREDRGQEEPTVYGPVTATLKGGDPTDLKTVHSSKWESMPSRPRGQAPAGSPRREQPCLRRSARLKEQPPRPPQPLCSLCDTPAEPPGVSVMRCISCTAVVCIFCSTPVELRAKFGKEKARAWGKLKFKRFTDPGTDPSIVLCDKKGCLSLVSKFNKMNTDYEARMSEDAW